MKKTLRCTLSFFLALLLTAALFCPAAAAAPAQGADTQTQDIQTQDSQTQDGEDQDGETPTPGAAARAQVPDLTLECTAAILVDLDNDHVLYDLNANEQRYPASITKVMTALLTLEAISRGELSLDTIVTVPQAALDGIPSDASNASIKAGEQMSVKDLLYCTMVRSANEAAAVLAITVSGDQESFAALMNQRAQELGMNDTHFVNANGLHHPDHYSTAHDLYLMCREAMTHSLFREIVSTGQYTVQPTNLTEKPRTLYNTNGLLVRYAYSGYVYNGTIGIKTGTTPEAGYCLASAVERQGHTLLAVVLGAETIENDAGVVVERKQFSQSIKLYDWAFENFSPTTLLDAENYREEVPARFSLQSDHIILQPADSVTAFIPGDYDPALLKLDIELKGGGAFAPITAGQVLGVCKVNYAGELYGTVDMKAVNDLDFSPFLAFVDSVNSFFGNLFVQILLIIAAVFLAAGIVHRVRTLRRRQAQLDRQRRLEHKRRLAEEQYQRQQARQREQFRPNGRPRPRDQYRDQRGSPRPPAVPGSRRDHRHRDR